MGYYTLKGIKMKNKYFKTILLLTISMFSLTSFSLNNSLISNNLQSDNGIIMLGSNAGQAKSLALTTKFLIIDLQRDPHIGKPYNYFFNIRKLYDQKFGPGSVQIVDASNSTVSSMKEYLINNQNVLNNVAFFWVISNHGFRNYDGGSTILYWGCDNNGCKQQANLTEFQQQISLNNILLSWFDACYTHVPSDGINNILDGTATGWVHIYSQKAYACGFSNYTNGFDVEYTSCVFKTVLQHYNLNTNKQIDPQNMLSAIEYCHNVVSSIGDVSLGAPYCTNNSTQNLPLGKIKYTRIVNAIQGSGSTTATLLYKDKKLEIPASSTDMPLVISASSLYNLISQDELEWAIENTRLQDVISNIKVQGSDGEVANCVDFASPNGLLNQVRFDKQFNGLNIIIGEDSKSVYCEIDYGYIADDSLTGKF